MRKTLVCIVAEYEVPDQMILNCQRRWRVCPLHHQKLVSDIHPADNVCETGSNRQDALLVFREIRLGGTLRKVR